MTFDAFIERAAAAVDLLAEIPDELDGELAVLAHEARREANSLCIEIEKHRKALKAPLTAQGKAVDKAAKALAEPLEQAIARVDVALLSLRTRQQALAVEQDASRQELAAEQSGAELPDLTGVSAPAAAVEIPVRKNKELVITDASRIPDEFWVIDLVALRKALLDGRSVPGAEMVEMESVR
jgi:hypothetical protein